MSDPANQSAARRTTGRQRFMAGALGALVPLLMMLVTLELEEFLADLDGYRIAGWVIRVAAMMALGGVAAWHFADDTVPKKVAVQLGMTWPAVLTAGGIGLQANSIVDDASDLSERAAEVAAEVDSLQVAGTDSIDLRHIEHIDAIELEAESARRAEPLARVIDGVLGTRRIRN